jgi:hypothetical protein
MASDVRPDDESGIFRYKVKKQVSNCSRTCSSTELAEVKTSGQIQEGRNSFEFRYDKLANRDSNSACCSWWRLPLLLGLVLLAILLSQGDGIRQAVFKPGSTASTDRGQAQPLQIVLLTINFGDGRPLLNESSDWHEAMTVGDLLNTEPRISFVTQGTGAAAFLTQLNGVTNEGTGGRNWVYSVNGKRADRSFAVYELRPNDHVLWTFAGRE